MPNGKALLRLIENGAEQCAARLSEISGCPWESRDVSIDDGSGNSFQGFFDAGLEDHYGAWLASAGAAFLTIFPRKSGLLVTDAFTRPSSARLDELDNREPKALAEVSNILVNAFTAPLSAALDRAIILSAPEMLIDSRRDLFLSALKKAAKLGSFSMVGYARLACLQSPIDCMVVIFLQR